MNLNGNAIIVKKRATDPELRADLDTLMSKAKKPMKHREKLLDSNISLAEDVKRIKRKSLEALDERVFDLAKGLRKTGVKVFIAKKPIDVAEYVRGFIDRERLGIVPSPQTLEAEVMQAFFMSNKVEVLSDKYSGQTGGKPFLHPFFPYLKEEETKESEATHVILSAVAVSNSGMYYLEKEEAEAFKKFKEPFVITSVDRIFTDRDAEKVVSLMEAASGEMISAEKEEAKGHLIILDNNRLSLARSNLKDILMCINCYSCSLYCPIYLSIGGLFGSPMMAGIGALSVSYQSGIKAGINRGLNYCTLCGRCDEECPVDVPIMHLIKEMRRKAKVSGL